MTRYLKKKKQPAKKFTILYDDRERKPWMFLQERWQMERVHLKVADYTIQGFENQIAIEKKSGLAELFTDLTAKYRPTFVRFLKKLSEYPIKCIIVEQPLTNPGIYSTLNILRKKSRNKIKLTPDTIFYWTSVITIEYNISMVFTDKTSVRQIVPVVFEEAYKKVRQL